MPANNLFLNTRKKIILVAMGLILGAHTGISENFASPMKATKIITHTPPNLELDKIETDYLNSRNYERCTQAIKILDKILARNQHDAHAHFIKGLAYHRRAYSLHARYKSSFRTKPEWTAALKSYNQAWLCGFRTDALFYHRGETKLAMGMTESALQDLNQSIAIDATKDWVWAARGYTYLCQGNKRAAHRDMLKAIELNPQRSANYAKLAALEEAMGAYPSARRAIDRAITIQPNVVDYRVHRAALALKANDQKTAEADIAATLAIDPTNAEALRLRGQLNIKQEHAEQAIDDLVAADQIYRSVVKPIEQEKTITADTAKKLFAKAAEQYKRLTAKDNAQYLYELGLLEWGLADWSASSARFKALLSNSHSVGATELHSAALYSLALESLRQSKNSTIVINRYKQFASGKSLAARIVLFLAGELALEQFDKTLKSDQERTVANFYVGAKLARQGNYKSAKERLSWVRDKGDRNLEQYLLSIIELARLENTVRLIGCTSTKIPSKLHFRTVVTTKAPLKRLTSFG